MPLVLLVVGATRSAWAAAVPRAEDGGPDGRGVKARFEVTARDDGDRSPSRDGGPSRLDGGVAQGSSRATPDAGIALTAEEEALLRPSTGHTHWPQPSPQQPIVLVREAPPPAAGKAKDAPAGVLLGTVIGLAAVVALAYLASRPRIRSLEERLGISQLVTAGFGFVLLGVLAREGGVLTDNILLELTPVLQFGLGWLGFLVGYRFDVRILDRLPRGTARAVGVTTALPLLSVAVSCGVTGYWLGWLSAGEAVTSALALGLAGAISTPRVGRFRAGFDPSPDLATLVRQLDEIASVVGLGLLSCYFRPGHVDLTWHLPGTVWLFIALGMGIAIGIVIYGALGIEGTGAEFLAVSLGSIAFASGMAGFLHLSPLVVCFVAGALVTNLPFAQGARLALTLEKLERPILLSFLTIAGAGWDVRDPRGWLLLPAFLVARIAGKFASAVILNGTPVAAQSPPSAGGNGHLSADDDRLVFAPMSVMSIAVILSVQSLYQSDSLAWAVTAVIAGTLVMEVLVRIRKAPSHPGATPHGAKRLDPAGGGNP